MMEFNYTAVSGLEDAEKQVKEGRRPQITITVKDSGRLTKVRVNLDRVSWNDAEGYKLEGFLSRDVVLGGVTHHQESDVLITAIFAVKKFVFVVL